MKGFFEALVDSWGRFHGHDDGSCCSPGDTPHAHALVAGEKANPTALGKQAQCMSAKFGDESKRSHNGILGDLAENHQLFVIY